MNAFLKHILKYQVELNDNGNKMFLLGFKLYIRFSGGLASVLHNSK